ncbi:MAG: OmpA family protein [Oscillospiraceae bacterium]|nr:OmpA family protein [Oscillospiraceae bacterium]
MAKLPPKKQEESTGEWLNTYADMVTLLLTFFVLLFACSNLDETKLQFIFQAFKSRGKYINQQVAPLDPSAQSSGGVTDTIDKNGGDGDMPQSFEELYTFLADYIDEMSLSESVALEQGAAHLTLRFDNSVFFDGDSHILKPEGREVLNGIIPALHAIDPMIAKMTIEGHTAKAVSNTNDYQLSCLRACSVQLHLANNNTVDDSKYYIGGAGPNKPLADNSTEEGRAQNRRVEITLLKNELDKTDPDVIKDILEHDYGLLFENFDPEDQTPPDYTTLPDGSADKIIGLIEDKYKDSVTNVGHYGPSAVDPSQFMAAAPAEDSGDDGADEE